MQRFLNIMRHIALWVPLAYTATACSQTNNSLALIDPLLPYVSRDTANAMKHAAARSIILPETDTRQALYAAIDASNERLFFVSPLLISEIPTILAAHPDKRIACVGTTAPRIHEAVFAVIFTQEGAARHAGTRIAAIAARKAAGTRIAAVFTDKDAADLFLASYKTAGGTEDIVMELAAQGFSAELAQKLKKIDIRLVYLSVPPNETELWAESAFDDTAWIIAEKPCIDFSAKLRVNEFVTWDSSAGMQLLVQNIAANKFGIESGPWKTIETPPRARKESAAR